MGVDGGGRAAAVYPLLAVQAHPHCAGYPISRIDELSPSDGVAQIPTNDRVEQRTIRPSQSTTVFA
ncbi:hypothetical protein [Caballeronia sp. dw_19]|uniref:hypothetical protein n=1 Tax=Caballeronia sp. dw_19 TaxID=2719791 RepID=UPI001BCED6DA|nr:hypothetical protein [Caballeronia sp. dw_19]